MIVLRGVPDATCRRPSPFFGQPAPFRGPIFLCGAYPKGINESIAQTSGGYLRLGTELGLLRFDGREERPMAAAS
jgi:hypothetical protein